MLKKKRDAFSCNALLYKGNHPLEHINPTKHVARGAHATAPQ